MTDDSDKEATAPVTFCAECGPGICVDEDGCCAACGNYACGEWVEKMAAALDGINQLAAFILAELNLAPEEGESAADTAIRLLRAAYTGHVVRARLELADSPLLPDKPIPRLATDLKRFIEWYGPFGVLDGLLRAFNMAPSPAAVDRMVGEHMAARQLLQQLAPLWERPRGNGIGG